MSDREGVAAVGHVVRPRLHHRTWPFPAGSRVYPTMRRVPVERGGQMAGAQVIEGVAFAGVDLSQVVRKRPHMAGVASSQRPPGATGADRQLAGSPTATNLAPRPPPPPGAFPRRTRSSWPLRPRPRHGEGKGPLARAPGARWHATVREATPAPSPRALAAWPEVAAPTW